MHPQIQKRISALYHKEPSSWRKIERGYTPAARWVVTFSDKTSAFVTMGTTPLPEDLLPNAGPMTAMISGFFAARAGLPSIPDAPKVRWIQQQLLTALPWAIRALQLPPLDLS
jgi:hypothetical protein